MVGKTGTLEERFWDKVSIASKNACWLWKANKNNKGYGMIRLGGLQRKVLAHRVSYEIHKDKIPENLVVMHSCDNPGCVNPNHLFLGTMLDNAQDKVKKGRHRWGVCPENKPPVLRGCSHGNARFNKEQVKNIKQLLNEGQASRAIARLFKVDKKLILGIKHGRTYVSDGLGG